MHFILDIRNYPRIYETIYLFFLWSCLCWRLEGRGTRRVKVLVTHWTKSSASTCWETAFIPYTARWGLTTDFIAAGRAGGAAPVELYRTSVRWSRSSSHSFIGIRQVATRECVARGMPCEVLVAAKAVLATSVIPAVIIKTSVIINWKISYVR